jgi:hypothetical protein
MKTNETANEIEVPEAPEAPDFTAEWAQIRADLENVAAGWLRIGLNLMKIRDALKPRGRWLPALREHGMSQPQASRYIRFAEKFAKMPEDERAIFLRAKGLSLSEAVGEGREEPSDYSPTNSRNFEDEVEIPADELEDRRAEVERQKNLAHKIVDAGVKALKGEPTPEYADDDARWASVLDEVAADVLAVLFAHLPAELKKRLLPC